MSNKEDKNGNWKGGIVHDNFHKRILILCPEHPNATKKGYVYLHRLVVEKSIGRYLRKDELVHHKDRNRSNNDISNLEIMTWKEHMKLHITKHVGCVIEGCSRKHRARGYCAYHYNLWLKQQGGHIVQKPRTN